jgi:hypothetical protein
VPVIVKLGQMIYSKVNQERLNVAMWFGIQKKKNQTSKKMILPNNN